VSSVVAPNIEPAGAIKAGPNTVGGVAIDSDPDWDGFGRARGEMADLPFRVLVIACEVVADLAGRLASSVRELNRVNAWFRVFEDGGYDGPSSTPAANEGASKFTRSKRRVEPTTGHVPSLILRPVGDLTLVCPGPL
jgi:hypothetical protein